MCLPITALKRNPPARHGSRCQSIICESKAPPLPEFDAHGRTKAHLRSPARSRGGAPRSEEPYCNPVPARNLELPATARLRTPFCRAAAFLERSSPAFPRRILRTTGSVCPVPSSNLRRPVYPASARSFPASFARYARSQRFATGAV